MGLRRRGWAAAGIAAVCFGSMPLYAEPLKLEAGKDVTLSCDTRSVVVADEAAATAGSARLKLTVAAGGTAERGTWSVADADAAHKGGLALRHKDACAKGCPFDTSAKGEIQLWAPEAKTLDKLADGEVLTVAVVKPDGLTLRASTFRGKDIESLEEGQCKLAP